MIDSASPLEINPLPRPPRHPYVIVAPAFSELSAGIRVLYWLCDALNRAGAEAWVMIADGPGDPEAGVKQGLRTPVLTAAHARTIYASGRTPIVIYPEIFDDVRADAVSVLYVLNYVGVLGARELPACDLVLAYSENIRRRTPRCEDVLFIPSSNARYWTPGPPARRRGALVYAGKYVDFHRQALPLHLHDARRIARFGPDAPSREQLRELFRTSERLYVFENTAVAAEAALCRCPVVACRNWFFPDLIAAQELGVEGFAFDDAPSALAHARDRIDRFGPTYLAAMKGVQIALERLVEATQAFAADRPATKPLRL